MSLSNTHDAVDFASGAQEIIDADAHLSRGIPVLNPVHDDHLLGSFRRIAFKMRLPIDVGSSSPKLDRSPAENQ